ncbi:MAG: cadmium-translocating P-type ATPase [Oscillospiraceae bacterium]|nr:cadmium-translocating P-type ATPase [Oscillospiraceae bacterium]
MARRLSRIIIGGILLSAGIFLQTDIRWIGLGLFLASYLIVGGDIVLKAAKNIIRGQVFDENFLMSAATIGAFIIGEYPEGIAVMLFYQVGELFQRYAVDKSRKSIASLMDIRPDYANVIKGGEISKVDPEDVQVGDTIIIKAGEKVPLDGTVVEGSSMLDTSALTGEPVPREARPGSEILSGCININGLLTVRTTKEYGESTVSKILDLVENATSQKAKTENFITKFAKYYTPVVVLLAALISIIPPLLISGASLEDWVYRGLTFLVISCPCALVVSIPLSFFGGIGGASRKGILIKGSNYLEVLARLETVVFDKTGTLTKGVFRVQEAHGIKMGRDALLELAAHAESYSNHPISMSIKAAYGKEIDYTRVSEVEEIAGHGVRATVDGKSVLAGNAKLLDKMGIQYRMVGGANDYEYSGGKDGDMMDGGGSMVLIAADGVFEGYIIIADEVKEDAPMAIRALKDAKIRKTVMLTGDAKSAGEAVARRLGMDMVHAELLPGDKVAKVEELLSQKSARGKLAFVGDGINDAPVLARADVGIAMGGLGSDAAIEAADVVIMTDEPSKITSGINIAKKTLGIVKQNIIFSLAVKFAVLILAALGIASMWGGVIADVGVTLLAVLNATRALNVKYS